MNYGEVLSKAWRIIWRNKVLWIFGILAGCGANRGNGGSFNFNMNGRNMPGGPQGRWEQWGQRILDYLQSIPPYVYVLVIVGVLLLAILALYLSTIGRIGLVLGTLRGDDGAERQNLGKLWRDSQPFFWRMFLLNLAVAIAGFVVFLVVLIPSVGLGVLTAGIGLICLLPLICVLGIAFWALSVWIEQSAVALVAENLDVLAALQRGWNVFRGNLGALILVALILLVLGFAAGLLLAIPMLITLVPLMIAMMREGRPMFGPLMSGSLVLLALYLPVLIVLNGILQSFISGVWALAFRRLTARPPVAGITPASTEPPRGAAVY